MTRHARVVAGMLLGLIGAAQVWQGVPGDYIPRGIAELQADASAVLPGIAWLIGGLACGVFALAFTPPLLTGAKHDAPPGPSRP